ncbi:hypothetical protein GOP47_0015611 [Adiantum capillus-veneris]|uniref:FHA domain-containing protein n=1 Tax=Adiantum capillus-veneris TaxID=13818 RepID=A0A9D4ZDD3_ADICA|nr:hypothetical protein GOP47_0015611 [Adiantum capillus-veneris]
MPKLSDAFFRLFPTSSACSQEKVAPMQTILSRAQVCARQLKPCDRFRAFHLGRCVRIVLGRFSFSEQRKHTIVLLQFAAPIMHRYSLDRFKKAQTEEPFSVNNGAVAQVAGSVASTQSRPPFTSMPARSPFPSTAITNQMLPPASQKSVAVEQVASPSSSIGGGQSTWQPPDWAVEPRPGLYWLDVVKDGEVVDKINLEKRRNIFGRQAIMCDFVLDHPSVSRQHAVVVQHKNGRSDLSQSLCRVVY